MPATLPGAITELVAGVDEVGRAPLAGPVMAAAVILTPDAEALLRQAKARDSKKMTRLHRERCVDIILRAEQDGLLWRAIGRAEVEEIDTINILQASLTAMARAVEALPHAPVRALVDGNQPPPLACPCETVVGGDDSVMAISAAAILAKVTRDRLMGALAADHPGYGWERNAGYPTAEHRAALERLGATAHHRRSFSTVRGILERNISIRS